MNDDKSKHKYPHEELCFCYLFGQTMDHPSYPSSHQDGPFEVKIGATHDPQERLVSSRTLRPTWTILHCWFSDIVENAGLKIEKRLHARFAEKRIENEIYSLSKRDIAWLKAQPAESFFFIEEQPLIYEIARDGRRKIIKTWGQNDKSDRELDFETMRVLSAREIGISNGDLKQFLDAKREREAAEKRFSKYRSIRRGMKERLAPERISMRGSDCYSPSEIRDQLLPPLLEAFGDET